MKSINFGCVFCLRNMKSINLGCALCLREITQDDNGLSLTIIENNIERMKDTHNVTLIGADLILQLSR